MGIDNCWHRVGARQKAPGETISPQKKNIALQEVVEILKLVFIFVVVAFVCFGLDF